MDVLIIPLLQLIQTLIKFYTWGLIIQVVISWLIAFRIVNTDNQILISLNMFLQKVTEPALQKIRSFLPHMAGIDISPMLLILFLMFISNVLNRLVVKII